MCMSSIAVRFAPLGRERLARGVRSASRTGMCALEFHKVQAQVRILYPTYIYIYIYIYTYTYIYIYIYIYMADSPDHGQLNTQKRTHFTNELKNTYPANRQNIGVQ